jgi:predicted PurR-regulated permease PerM
MPSNRVDEKEVLLWITIAAAIGFLLYLLAPILTPFLFAAILAYICHPLVDSLAKRKVPRSLAAALVLALLAAIAVLLVIIMLPMLVRQVRAVAEQFPAYVDWIRGAFGPWIQTTFGVELDMQLVKDWVSDHVAEIQKFAVKMLPTLGTGGLALVEFALNLILIPVVTFYLLRDWDKLTKNIDVMIPRRWHTEARAIFRDIDRVLGEFLRGQLLVMLLMGIFYVVALWAVGLQYALAVGLISGLLTFIPFVGVITGLVLATLTGLLQFGGAWTPLLWVWGVFFVANLLEGYVFVPLLVGDRVGLHPVAVIFGMLAFGQLFGFFGVLLAVPASAALLVYLRYLRGKYLGSGVYNARG